MTRSLVAALTATSLCGCLSVPFKAPTLHQVTDADPLTIRNAFAAQHAQRFAVWNAVTFEPLIDCVCFDYCPRRLSVLGFVEVDASKESFTLVCMTHTGFDLFQLEGVGERIECPMVRDQLLAMFPEGAGLDGKVLAERVGRDIRRIYFDLVPPPSAVPMNATHTVTFTNVRCRERDVYVFGGEGLPLIQKHYYDEKGLVCDIGYYEYRRRNGALLPRGIVLHNRRYQYRLIIRLSDEE